MASGGYRKPSQPAPASGPGRLSRRTDGGPGQKQRDLPNAGYGEGQDFSQIQSGAPLNLAPGALGPSASGPTGSPVDVVPFGSPSMRPGEPVTAGAPLGDGMGPEGLGLPSSAELQQQDAASLLNALPVWEYLANMPGSAPSTRAIVRRIKALVSGM